MQASGPLLLRSGSVARQTFVPCSNILKPARNQHSAYAPWAPTRRELANCQRSKLPRAAATPDGPQNADKIDVDTLQLEDPFGMVSDVMTSGNLRCATPDQPLSAAASKLDKVTGLAVVDKENVVVGVVSIKDINRLKKQGLDLTKVAVKSHMSSPPIVVREKTRIGEAAALMLSKNIHRLPVVDNDGKLIGIVSRTDIFSPLLQPNGGVMESLTGLPDFEGKAQLADAFQRSIDEDAAVSLSSLDVEDTWTIKYLYDGDCDMCNQLMSTLKSKDGGQGRIKFVNIASLAYNPKDNEGVTYEDAMETIHAIMRDGTIITGPNALRALYDAVGWGWIASFMALPVVDQIVDIFYKIIAKYRLPMSGTLNTLTAMRRVTLTDAGVEHCVDDEEECEAVNW